jgi:DNA (cytosine-5)-methyltransferase 1
MNELALFAGGGGGILGGKLLGWRTVCAVEIDSYARRILLARQRDGLLDPFPIWDDVSTFDGTPWRGHVDVISGGFPCQDISIAGSGKGISGEKSGLWGEMARIVGEVRSRYVIVENSPMLTSRGLGTVLGDLAEMGYDAKWGVLGAYHAGAPHKRDRIWILARHADSYSEPAQPVHAQASRVPGLVAHSNSISRATRGERALDEEENRQRGNHQGRSLGNDRGRSVQETRCNPCSEKLANTIGNGLEGLEQTGTKKGATYRPSNGGNTSWWEVEPNVGRVVDGVAHRMDRLRATGNGQVPAVLELAWRMLS